MTLYEVITDIHVLNEQMQEYEKKYGVLSKDFYALYINGELRDEEVEEIKDFSRWAGLYEIRLHREEVYEEMIRDLLRSLRVSSPAGKLDLASNPLLAGTRG